MQCRKAAGAPHTLFDINCARGRRR